MKIDGKNVAKLANLTISSEEESKLEKQLESILSYFEKLKEVDTSGVEETSQVTGLENVTRVDTATDCGLSQEEAMSGTKSKHNDLFKVKGILNSE